MIVVYGGDRTWRLALDVALREAGMAVRTASRQAELAKCLTAAHGAVQMVIAGPAYDDEAVVHTTIASLAAHLQAQHSVLTTTPGESIGAIVRRAQLLRER